MFYDLLSAILWYTRPARHTHGSGYQRRPFWSGESKIKSVVGNWQRSLQRLFT